MATLLAGVAAALGGWASHGGVPDGEVDLARWIYDLPSWSTPGWRAVMQVGARPAIVVVAILLAVRGSLRSGLCAVVAGFGAWALTDAVLKDWIERGRPTAATLGRPLRDSVEGLGFPSTHAAVSAALVATVLVTLPLSWRWRAGLALVPLGTAAARVHVGAHWPLDVAGGLAVGGATAMLVALVLAPRS